MEPTGGIWRLLIGLIVLCAPLYFVIGPWLTRKWPTATAKVIELKSNKAKGLRGWILGHFTETDYGIEYEVNGQTYTKNPNIEGYVQGGFSGAQYFPLVPWKFDVRYRPDDPGHYSIVHAYKPWVVCVASLICVLVGLAMLWPQW